MFELNDLRGNFNYYYDFYISAKEKSYSEAFTNNIWIDDIIVVDATIRKYLSVLPRVEINLMYSNQLYNYHQYKSMIKRKDYNERMNVQYFSLKGK